MSSTPLQSTARALVRALRSRDEKKLDQVTDFLAHEYGRKWQGILDQLCDLASDLPELTNPEAETVAAAILTGQPYRQFLQTALAHHATYASF